jgi:hypothetical protein
MVLNECVVADVAVEWAERLLSRRDALRRLGLLGVTGAAALLAACGDDEATPVSTVGRPVTLAAAAPSMSTALAPSNAPISSSSAAEGTRAPTTRQYSLTVTNGSTRDLDVALYQRSVDLGVPDARPLAWLTRSSSPHSEVAFNWSLDYSFVWAETGTLQPGVVFAVEETVPADPNDLSSNQVEFDNHQGELTLVPVSDPGAEVGNLYVRVSAAVPPDIFAVGIGMSDAPVFAVSAQPNSNLVFHANPEYWIAAGMFTAGQVVDPDRITSQVQVTFDGAFAMKAELQDNGDWVVGPV